MSMLYVVPFLLPRWEPTALDMITQGTEGHDLARTDRTTTTFTKKKRNVAPMRKKIAKKIIPARRDDPRAAGADNDFTFAPGRSFRASRKMVGIPA
jgi:hypothetical protein